MDCPKPEKVVISSIDDGLCPICGYHSKPHSRQTRVLRDLDQKTIHVYFKKYFCDRCMKHFTSRNAVKMFGVGRQYAPGVRHLAISLFLEHTLSYVRDLLYKRGVTVPLTTLFEWKKEAYGYGNKRHQVRARRPLE